MLGNDPENGNSHAQSTFCVVFQLHGICEILHEIFLVTGYMSYKSGVSLVMDFGGPSDSFYCLFYVGSFLTLLFAIEYIAIWEGNMTPSPPWILPLLIMKHEVLAAILV